MVALWRLVVGGVAAVLGVAWVLAPTRMSRLQTRVLYFGLADDDYEQTDRQQLLGRVSGAILAVLGVAFALGLSL
ncbi:hypothetical protein ACFQMA_04970 [Halosimplex aquaticum]|uniref:DUF6199 domain-containing protein n=1 Tax=Halosimplex aquaticum TaxID=3026162 RepID=A0ABD5XZY6_9EURY|nr:hypothetical protein [Halosimplex aquaticum]